MDENFPSGSLNNTQTSKHQHYKQLLIHTFNTSILKYITSFSLSFYQRSKFPTYQKMWSFMKSATPSVFVANSKEGERRVLQGDYAYFAESSTIEYMVERNCELMQVGQWLDSKGFGIGLPQGECACLLHRPSSLKSSMKSL